MQIVPNFSGRIKAPPSTPRCCYCDAALTDGAGGYVGRMLALCQRCARCLDCLSRPDCGDDVLELLRRGEG